MNPINKKILIVLSGIVIVTLIVIIGTNLYLKQLSDAGYTRVQEYKQKNQWMNMGIDNCIIFSKDKNLEVYKILLQRNIFFDKLRRAIFYNSDGMKYPAEIDINPISGLAYISTLENNNQIWINFDYKKFTCNVWKSTPDVKTIFNKDGYMSMTFKLDDLDDWNIAMYANTHKKIKNKKQFDH